ncbi:unnamed protein product, partial [marine sediment metagenome]
RELVFSEVSTVIYESEHNYILVKEVSNGTVLMVVTKEKTIGTFNAVMNDLNGEDFQNLKKFLSRDDF